MAAHGKFGRADTDGKVTAPARQLRSYGRPPWQRSAGPPHTATSHDERDRSVREPEVLGVGCGDGSLKPQVALSSRASLHVRTGPAREDHMTHIGPHDRIIVLFLWKSNYVFEEHVWVL
jgi:hypothetical protein